MTNSYCKSFPDDPEKCVTIHKLRIGFGFVSLLGSLFMIVMILCLKRYAVFEQRMILSLSIAALLESIAYIMSYFNEHGTWCSFKGWWLTFFGWAVLLWVIGITFNLYMNACKHKPTAKFEWLYHAVCWGLPIIISLLPIITGGWYYGPAGAWCWIDDVGWRLGIWFGPLWGIILLLGVSYFYIIRKLRTTAKKTRRSEETNDPEAQHQIKLNKEEINSLPWYPFIYLLLSLCPLINSIQNVISPNNNISGLMIAASISSSLHGVVNALAFGLLDTDILLKLKRSLPHRCKCNNRQRALLHCCKCKSEEEEEQHLTDSVQTLQ